MSYNLIPVLTVDDNKYDQPTQHEGGLYVVNKGVLQDAPANKFYFYNPHTKKYYNINEQTASPDYLKQITDYEEQLKFADRGVSYTTDSTQINSVADVVSMLFSGKILDAVKGTGELIENTVLTPLFAKDYKGKRASTLFNNLIVNLSETMDYATGANYVKGVMQGKNPLKGQYWDSETGRVQYDYNTGSNTTDFMLELISDPTNWFTFGGKAFIGNAIKSSVDDVAVSMGLTVNKKYLNKITRGMYESFGDDSMLRNVNVKTLFNLADTTTADDIAGIVRNIRTAIDTKAAYKNSSLIKSVMGTSDALEKAAFKATVLTSGLGLEGWAVKSVLKGGHQMWLNSQLGRMLRRNKTNGEFKLVDYTKLQDELTQMDATISNLSGLYGKYSPDVVNRATKTMQMSAMKELNSIILRDVESPDYLYELVNKWAVSNGYVDALNALEDLKTIANKVDGSLQNVTSVLENLLTDIDVLKTQKELTGYRDIIETLLDNAINPDKFSAVVDGYNVRFAEVYEKNPMGEVLLRNKTLYKSFDRLDKLNISDSDKAIIKNALHTAVANNALEVAHYYTSLLPRKNTEWTLYELEGIIENLKTLIDSISVLPEGFAIHRILNELLDMYNRVADWGWETVRYAIVKYMERLKAYTVNKVETKQWQITLDKVLQTITKYEDETIKAMNTDGRYIDLSAYKSAGARNKSQHNIISNSVDMDSSKAFLRPKHADTMSTVTAFIKGEDAYMDILYDILNKYNFKDVEEDISLLHDLFDKNVQETVTEFIDSLGNKNTVTDYLMSQYDLENVADVLRRRIRELRSSEETYTKEAASEFVKKNLGKQDTDEDLNMFVRTTQTYVTEAEKDARLLENILQHIDYAITESRYTQYARTPVTKEQVLSPWYVLKESQADATQTLLNDANLTKTLNSILNNEDIGSVVKLIENSEDIASQSAATLSAFAESAYIYGELVKDFNNHPAIGKEMAAALIDSLAGITREHITDIYVDSLTNKLVDSAKSFISNTNNTVPNVSGYIRDSYTPTDIVDVFSGRTLYKSKEYIVPSKKTTRVDFDAEGSPVGEVVEISTPVTKKHTVEHTPIFYNPGTADLEQYEEYIQKLYSNKTETRILPSNWTHYATFNHNDDFVEHFEYNPNGTTAVNVDVVDARKGYLRLSKEFYNSLPEDSFKVFYSIGQRSTDEGMFEFVCELPEEIPGYGTRVHFIDDTVNVQELYNRDYYLKNVWGLNEKVDVSGYAPNAVHCASTDEFVVKLSNFLDALVSHVNPKEAPNLRSTYFIGWGNSEAYNKQDKLFNIFMNKHKLNFRINNRIDHRTYVKSADYKEFLTTKLGGVPVDSETYEAVESILQKYKAHLDVLNSKSEIVETALMPDLSRDLLTAIDNISLYLRDELYFRNSSKVSKKSGSVLSELPEAVLVDVYHRFKDFSDLVSENMRTLRMENDNLSREIVVSKVFGDLFGIKNLQNYIKTNLTHSSEGGVLKYALKKLNDPYLLKEWLDLNTFKPNDATKVMFMNKFLEQLQRHTNRISNIDLVYAESSFKGAPVVIKALEDILSKSSSSKIVRRNIEFVKEFRKDLLPEQLYAVAYYYATAFKNLPKDTYDYFKSLLTTNWGKNNLDAYSFFGLVDDALNNVYNKKGVYHPQLHTEKFDKALNEEFDVYEAVEAVKEIERVNETTACLEEVFKTTDEIMSKHLVNDNIFKVARPMLDAYISFVSILHDAIKSAKEYYSEAMKNAKDAVGSYAAKVLYTNKLKYIHGKMQQLSDYIAFSRAHNILKMDIKDYETYLYKHSQGIQLFDIKSKVFASEENMNALLSRIEFLNSPANTTSLRAALSNSLDESGYYIIYIDKNVSEEYLDDLDKRVLSTRFAVEFPDLSALPEFENLYDNPLLEAYKNFVRSVDNTYDTAYSLSMHRAMNEDRFEELLKFLPDLIKNNTLSLEYLTSKGLVQHGLNHSVVGDYASGLSSVFEIYSGNLIVNIHSGLSKLYKQHQMPTSAYVQLFTSPANSLKTRVDMVASLTGTPLSHKEVHAALESQGCKAVSFDGKELKVWNIASAKDLEEAFNNNVVVMDSAVYDNVHRVIMDNSLPKWWTKSGIASYLTLLKLGQLQSVGLVMRNFIDATVKGMLEVGGGVEYLRMFPDFIRELKEFDKILVQVQEKFDTLSENSIKAFYKKADTTVSTFFTEQEVLDIFEYFKNSASVPTPAQISALYNISERITKSFSETSKITKVEVDTLLKAFVDNEGDYFAVRGALKERFEPDMVNALMSRFREIPRGYAKLKTDNFYAKVSDYLVNNPLMKANNWIERIERYAVYRFSRLKGNTVGRAIAAVNRSQFNRAYDSVGRRILELLFPFSSYQVDNMMFWLNTLTSIKGSTIGVITDYLQARYNEEELTPEEVLTNASVQYMFLEGNILLDENNDLVLKVSDSLSNTMKILADPVSLKDSLLVPAEKLIEFAKACMQDKEEYEANKYGKVKPIEDWEAKDWFDYGAELTPLFGAWWLRQQTAWTEEATPLTTFFRRIAPSVFGKVKRTGYDWYNQTEEYRKSHMFVPGISYVPKWMLSNPMTYVNTIQRLQNMGYDKETATKMVVDWGYYMKAPDYILRQHTPKVSVRKPTYTKKVYTKKVYPKSFKMISGGDRYRTTKFGVARIYRLTSMYDRITKSGTSRMTMMLGRGHGASSIRVVRDRIKNNTIRRQRQRRILHM